MRYPRETLYFYADQKKALSQLAKACGKPKSHIMRLALNEFFEHHQTDDPLFQEWKDKNKLRELSRESKWLREQRNDILRDGTFNAQYSRSRLGGDVSELATPETDTRFNPTYLPQRPSRSKYISDPEEREIFGLIQTKLEGIAKEKIKIMKRLIGENKT